MTYIDLLITGERVGTAALTFLNREPHEKNGRIEGGITLLTPGTTCLAQFPLNLEEADGKQKLENGSAFIRIPWGTDYDRQRNLVHGVLLFLRTKLCSLNTPRNTIRWAITHDGSEEEIAKSEERRTLVAEYVVGIYDENSSFTSIAPVIRYKEDPIIPTKPDIISIVGEPEYDGQLALKFA